MGQEGRRRQGACNFDASRPGEFGGIKSAEFEG